MDLPAPEAAVASVIPPTPPRYPYWAADTAEIGAKLVSKVENYKDVAIVREMSTRYARAYQYYYGLDPSGVHATSQVLRKGEQDELAAVRVNHSRPLVNTLVNIITASKVAWTPKATNGDYQSIRDCELAAAVLEYYFAEAQVSKFAVRALEEALVFGEGYILLEWDSEAGDDHAAIDDRMIKTGDARFTNVSAWDVIRDPGKASYEALDWVIVRRYVNRYDLIANYPHFEGQIAGAGERETQRLGSQPVRADSDDVAVYHFYHSRSAALPTGRHVLFLENRLVLEDEPLDLTDLPLYRVSAFDLVGTPFAYTAYWDILGIQELQDSLQTSIATNQSTFGTQLIAVEKGSEVDPDDIGGMRLLYVEPGSTPPSAINLTQTPAEIFKHLETLQSHQRLLMGLNAVVQGETPSGELSGSALALLDAKALQQSSTIQSNWLRLLEKLGSGLLEMFHMFANVPKKIAVVGESSRYLVTETSYTGQSFERIKSVRVELGNPMAQHPAGRYEMAKELAGLGVVKTPEQILQVLQTGQLKPLTSSLAAELTLIQSENQALLRGENPPTIAIDDHMLHAREHRAVLANPEARSNPDIVKAILMHITEHENLYYTTPPTTLMLVGQQPPPMMGMPGMPPPPGAGPAGPPPESAAPVNAPGNPAAGKPSDLPEMPTNPRTGERAPAPPNAAPPL